ncbi:MBL fold metallo-hydrolase, partial [Staphylococcus epidermidis]|uniref:MBL fold metallo-hydrolase n=1 Tax=Staphylococcus epidermidis TaxID=1282 RepID=UPI0021B38A18
TLSEAPAEIEAFKFKLLHTPPHSPPTLTFLFNHFPLLPHTLFKNPIPPTHLYNPHYQTLIHSIKHKLFQLHPH